MTQTKSISPARALTRFLARERLTEMARARGVMQRERKTDMFAFQLFDRIGRNGGYFLTRLKCNSNPILHTVHRRWRGRAIPVEGQHLRDVLPRLERGLLDAEVHLTFKRRKYNGKRRTDTTPFRLVAVRNKGTGDYHCYLTNAPPHMLPAEDIARTYALRWQVERFFKAMKHHGHLDHLPTRRRPVLDCLTWASILATLASQTLYRIVRNAACKNRCLPMLRWAALFARVAPALPILLRHYSARIDKELGRILIRDAPDPNRARPDRAIGHQLLDPVP